MTNILASFEEYKAYLQGLVDENEVLNTMVMGTSERVLRRRASNLNYPVAWLAFPDIAIDPEGNERYSSTIFFLDYAENEEDAEDAALLRMLGVARWFHRRLREDGNQGMFTYNDNEVVLQVKPRMSADNDHGYVLDFDLVLAGPGCD